MTLAERLTNYFYLWERRGRGWDFAGVPVGLEPPFAPFQPLSALPKRDEDDGAHATYLHFLFRKLFPARKPEPLAALALPEPKALADSQMAVFGISLPRSFDLDGYEAQQLLLMFSYCSHPVSFEVVGSAGSIAIQIACSESDASHVQSQIKTYYPTCTVLRSEDVLKKFGPARFETLEFGLSQEFMRPIATHDASEPSMHLGLKGIFDSLKDNERACLQVLFQGTKYPWPVSIVRSVSDGKGHSFFEDAPEMPKLAQKKTSSQLFGAIVRVCAASDTAAGAKALIRSMGHAVAKQSASQSNSLMPLSDEGYDPAQHMEDIIARRSRRYGMLLNVEELATFVHVPDDAVLANALSLVHSKTKPVPAELRNLPHSLGMNVHQGTAVPATVNDAQRFTHAHVIGATGTGKSTFLLHSVEQDIRNGNGLALIDPHGDLVDAALGIIPAGRLTDVILVDPSDPDYSIGFNVLRANTELEKEVLSSDLVSMFQKLSTSWGDQMTSVLANALLAFLESSEGGTLLDVRRFLLEPSFRASVLKTVSDPSINYYWTHEFPLIKTNSVGSILTRLDAFLRPKAIRHMVAQKEGLNFADILDGRKILLVKLSHGLIGESNSYLLGSLFLSKIYQTALGRQSASTADRRGFFVYVDEFHHFVTQSLSHLLSGARKYSLGLTLAHQSLEQISSANSELAASLIGNAGIRACFRLGESDAQKLEKGFASFDANDLMNLGTGQAVCRVGRADMDFNISVPKELPTGTFVSTSEVIEASQKKYGILRKSLDPLIEPRVEAVEPPAAKADETEVAPKEEVKIVHKEIPKDAPVGESKTIEDPQFIQSIVRRREESKHKYLQMLIKRNAESRGYKATLEQATKDGGGRIDIVLQKDKLVYAIEIGVTTTKEWEVHNIKKCLADGYENVIALSEDAKGTDAMIRKLAESGILPERAKNVRVFDLMGFMALLDKEDAPKEAKAKTIKGYRVKVEYGDKSK